ncbi:hypothetical protein [Mesorhizobium sp. J428]|uniref:hypothetical protein n=1 Tax=Mesorhizobium sp. J428 TaxID=2898440 RepID=UPI002150F710|nr:hypothetical protein [Mesorhizobium sp. J428]MCR5859740.1 hypothetical protein [Mesorhizobium sp. J428]
MRQETTKAFLEKALAQALYDDRRFLIYLIEMAIEECNSAAAVTAARREAIVKKIMHQHDPDQSRLEMA